MSTSRSSFSTYSAMVVLCCLLSRAGCALAEEPRVEPRSNGGRPAPDRAPPTGPAREPARSDLHLDFAPSSKAEPRFDQPLDRKQQPFAAPGEWGTEFRLRGQSLSSPQPAALGLDTAPTLHATNAWQRLEDFKARRGIRLLTLWENKFSTISLQTGKSGNPSLQWTSRSFSSGDASHGLFDRLVSKGLDELDSLEHRGGTSSETPAAQK
jgi:hypothetical protein